MNREPQSEAQTAPQTEVQGEPGAVGMSAGDPVSASPLPSESATEPGPDVLPEPVNVLMATLWILLFGGRWLGVPLLQMSGLLTPESVAFLDDGPLQKIYLILLSITLLVLALRTVRNIQAQKT